MYARGVVTAICLAVATLVAPTPVATSTAASVDTSAAASQRQAAPAAATGRLNPVNPVIVRDRAGTALPGRLAAGSARTVAITDGFGVPAVDVTAVVVQVTLRGARSAGGLRVAAPSDLARSPVALLYGARDVAQNQLVVPLDGSGRLAFRATSAVLVGVTVVGYLDGSTAHPDLTVLRTPARALDTRGTGPARSGRGVVADLRRRVAVPPTARAVLANLTVMGPNSTGFVEIRPTGTARTKTPAAAVTRGRDQSNLVLIPLTSRGSVTLSPARGTVDLVLDVVGFVTAPSGAGASGAIAAPRATRVLDTKSSRAYPAATNLPVRVAGTRGVPATATSVTAIVTAVGGTSSGKAYVAPLAARSGWSPVEVETPRAARRSVLVTVPLGPTGALGVRRSSQAHVVIDVVGWTIARPAVARPADTAALQQPPVELPTAPGEAPAEEQHRLAARILVQSSRYALGTWWTDVRPGLLGTDLADLSRPTAGRGLERSVKTDALADSARRIANICLGLATNLSTGTWDTDRIGVTPALATERLVGLVDFLVGRHLTQRVDGWGGGWQGSLVAGYLGRAAWLTWAELSVPTRDAVTEMVAFEADDISGRGEGKSYLRDRAGVLLGTGGDSKAEETSWQALPVQLALAMMPDHDHREQWSFSATRSALSSWARPADVRRQDVVQGRPLGSWLNGSNVEPDGVVRNHNRVAPDYMALVYQTLDQVWVQALVGEAAPAASRALVGPVVEAFTGIDFAAGPYAAPGGRIYPSGTAEVYYPEDVDWGAGMQLVYALMDTGAAAYGVGDAATAEEYSLLHLRAAAAMQDRFADGRTYCGTYEVGCEAGQRPELNYVGREELISQLAAQTMLALEVRDAGLVSFTDAAWSDF